MVASSGRTLIRNTVHWSTKPVGGRVGGRFELEFQVGQARADGVEHNLFQDAEQRGSDREHGEPPDVTANHARHPL
jgi:hypothetical protein